MEASPFHREVLEDHGVEVLQVDFPAEEDPPEEEVLQVDGKATTLKNEFP